MVPNAVLAGPHSKGLLETSEDDWDAMLDVGLTGVFRCCQRAVRTMLGQEPIGEARGRLILISSQHGMVGTPGHVAYCAIKGGIVNLTRQLAVDFARRGILVNAIAPGKILTAPLDEPDSAGDPRLLPRPHAVPAPRPAPRRRQRRGLPGLRRVELHQRHEPARRRRLDGVLSPRPWYRRAPQRGPGRSGAVSEGQGEAGTPAPPRGGYAPSPRPTFDRPTLIRHRDATRHVWGDDEAGHVADLIYASTGGIHLLVFELPPGGAFLHSPEHRTVFGADEVLHVLEGTMVLANPETGEVHRVPQGGRVYFGPDTWHHAFAHGGTPLRVLEIFAPPPAAGTSGAYARTKPYLERSRYADDGVLGALPAAARQPGTMRVLRDEDVVWRRDLGVLAGVAGQHGGADRAHPRDQPRRGGGGARARRRRGAVPAGRRPLGAGLARGAALRLRGRAARRRVPAGGLRARVPQLRRRRWPRPWSASRRATCRASAAARAARRACARSYCRRNRTITSRASASSCMRRRGPAALGQHVVGLDGAALQQLVAHGAGEREVGEAVAVEVAELAAADAELDAAEAVRVDLHVRPGAHLGDDERVTGRHAAQHAPSSALEVKR